jgi:hypothetical protein
MVVDRKGRNWAHEGTSIKCYQHAFPLNKTMILLVIAAACWPSFPQDVEFSVYTIKHKSRDNSVGIELGYGLNDQGSRIRFPVRAGNFSLHHRVQNGSRAHPVSYPMGTKGSFRGVKATGAWSWPLPSSAEVKNAWSYTSTPQYVFMEWCLVKHRN